jgi:hypothetical protein
MSPLPVTFGLIDRNKRERIRVALDEFKGHVLVDVRTFYLDGDGDLKPTPKGITIRPEFLSRVIALLQEAEREVRARGLVE